MQLPHVLHKRVGFVTALARNRFNWIKSRLLRQIAYHGAKHVGMTLNVFRDTRSDLFLIFEHKAEYSIPLYFLLLCKGKPVFFFVHDMQQCAISKLRSRIALNICRAFVRVGKFYPIFISLNDAQLEKSFRFAPEKTLTIPHPHHLANGPAPVRVRRAPGQRLRVGIIETTRKEKSVQNLLQILEKAQARLDFELVIGVPLLKCPAWCKQTPWEIFDTTTEAQYSGYFRSLDIFVVDFLRSDYWFRPSGAVVDAGMNGCYVICPDFPVFRAQIEIPVSIGSTFSNLEEIPRVLEKAIDRLKTETVDFETWRRYHRTENIALQFKTFFDEKIQPNPAPG